jgi:hypothetical protein
MFLYLKIILTCKFIIMKNAPKKMSLEALKEKAGQVATQELMNKISGGITSSCHSRLTAGGCIMK